jgi:hypothetical protein
VLTRTSAKRPERHIVGNPRCVERLRVGAAEVAQRGAGADQAEIEEIGTEAAGLELELPELEYAVLSANRRNAVW